MDPAHLRRLKRAVPALHRWYRRAGRDLPWRRTRDPYRIWVSEVMLQQTRVVTVVPYFEAWLEAFPTLADLAQADEHRVLRLWEGLGYYSRARNLHRAAQLVVRRFDGRVPSDPELFGSLPGVGVYTTAAVMSIAFDIELPALDGNVKRVLARILAMRQDPRRSPATRRLEELATRLIPRGSAALHNQAMMELGAMICAPRSPDCDRCPLRRPCLGRASGDPESFPERTPRPEIPHHHLAVGLVFHRGALLVRRRPPQGFLGGLWELPRVRVEPGSDVDRALIDGLKRDHQLAVRVTERLSEVRHAYSHFKVTLHPRRCRLVRARSLAAESSPLRWLEPPELTALAMARADRKVLELISQGRSALPRG